MAQKQIRICDRCGAEQEYSATTDWTVVRITTTKSQGQGNEKAYDLCGSCSARAKGFIVDYGK